MVQFEMCWPREELFFAVGWQWGMRKHPLCKYMGCWISPQQQLPCLFSLQGDWPLWWGRTSEDSVFLRQRGHRVFSPEGLPPPGRCLVSPVAGRKKPAGVEGFGRATSGFLFLGLPRWQGQGTAGSSACQSKGSFQKSARAPKLQAKKPALHTCGSCLFHPTGSIIWTRAQRPFR